MLSRVRTLTCCSINNSEVDEKAAAIAERKEAIQRKLQALLRGGGGKNNPLPPEVQSELERSSSLVADVAVGKRSG